jgi:hypothetical protein
VKTLTDAVGLRALGPGARVIEVISKSFQQRSR